ncbi:MAG: hypothetical protein SF123_10615, partial [Chloroflexota bacterium]|nr:hypothetical protein [Chloroflexota bacterium]
SSLSPVQRTPIWDAGRYWDVSQQVRSQFCTTFAFCTPDDHEPIHVGQFLVLGRDGLLPVFAAALITVLPNEPSTLYFVFAVTETLICLIIFHVLLRLHFPLWVAALAALLYATYTPTIVGSAMVLQQPLIRFAIVTTVWAYTLAVTTQRSWQRFIWVGLGTVCAAVIGFSSVTTRPLMTIVPVAVLLLSLIAPKLRNIVVPQLAWLVVLVAGIVWTVAYMVSLPNSSGFVPSLLQLLTSISPDANTYTQVTVLSFPHFWAPTDWFAMPELQNASLVGDLTREPVSFLYWWVFSIVGNWRNPDTLMLGRYFLTLDQQQFWHVVVLVTGLVGLAWLVGQTGARRFVTLLMLVIGGYLTLAYSAITIEPRRLSVLMPLVTLGATVAICALLPLLRQRPRYVDLLLLIACAAVWMLPLGIWMLFAPTAILGHAFWVSARFVLTAAVIGRLLMYWRQHEETRVLPVLPAIGLLTSLILVCVVHFQDSDWRTWIAPVTTPVRQTIENFVLRDDLHPWLLVDTVHPSDAEALEIRLNGEIVKPAGEPMLRWEAGLPPLWIPYEQIAERAGNPYRASWFALPLTRQQVQADTLEATLRADMPVELRGDYLDSGDAFPGPLFDPWHSGQSLWRWLANAYRRPYSLAANPEWNIYQCAVARRGWQLA